MSTIPWSDNKNARQVYAEYVEVWGFTYEGDTSDGHHVFRYPPTGAQVTLAHSPSAGFSWVKARRDEAAKITGRRFRGKRDARAAKARAAMPIQQRREAQRRALAERQAARESTAHRQAVHRIRQMINDNTTTIRAIRHGLPDLRTVAQRRYAEAAIARLQNDNIILEAQI